MPIKPIDFSGRLVVHIGPHKTGITSIQRALAGEYERLRDTGILYPKAGRMRNGKMLPWHHPLVLSLIEELNRDGGCHLHYSEIVSDMSEEIKETKPDTVIISSEVLAREHLSSQVFRDIKSLFPKAERIWVAYLRKQDNLAISRYAEHIKVGILSWPDSIRHVTRP